MSTTATVQPELEHWIIEQARTGTPPEAVLQRLLEQGWSEQAAMEAVEQVLQKHLRDQSGHNGIPMPVRVPSPIDLNGRAVLDLGDRQVQVIASLLLPRVVVLGGLLSHEECDALVEASRHKLSRSTTVDMESGGNMVHPDRTSEGTYFNRGEDELCTRIEARIARLLDWPLDHGEGLQILHYRVGAQYRPHYDYFDPDRPGSQPLLANGGQRVATVVMYLITPECGGATTFPDAHFEAAAIKGNAVFFSYDRAHPASRSLHGGAPVVAGEKWIATKWLRERPYR